MTQLLCPRVFFLCSDALWGWADILFLKHTSSIFRQSSNPVCGSSIMEQVRLCTVWPMDNWLGSSMNHIQGWMTVWESCCHASEKGCLRLCSLLGSRECLDSSNLAVFSTKLRLELLPAAAFAIASCHPASIILEIFFAFSAVSRSTNGFKRKKAGKFGALHSLELNHDRDLNSSWERLW